MPVPDAPSAPQLRQTRLSIAQVPSAQKNTICDGLTASSVPHRRMTGVSASATAVGIPQTPVVINPIDSKTSPQTDPQFPSESAPHPRQLGCADRGLVRPVRVPEGVALGRPNFDRHHWPEHRHSMAPFSSDQCDVIYGAPLSMTMWYRVSMSPAP